MDDRSSEGLFGFRKDAYGGSFNADLLEQYKLYVQSAENVSARRVASSRYLLTLNAALVALYGFQSPNLSPIEWVVPVPILGILVSVLWHRIIKSHKDLNAVKFDIIHELEKRLPVSLYAHEWRLANKGHGMAYRAVTDIERWIPIAFLVLHVILSILLVWSVLPEWITYLVERTE